MKHPSGVPPCILLFLQSYFTICHLDASFMLSSVASLTCLRISRTARPLYSFDHDLPCNPSGVCSFVVGCRAHSCWTECLCAGLRTCPYFGTQQNKLFVDNLSHLWSHRSHLLICLPLSYPFSLTRLFQIGNIGVCFPSANLSTVPVAAKIFSETSLAGFSVLQRRARQSGIATFITS